MTTYLATVGGVYTLRLFQVGIGVPGAGGPPSGAAGGVLAGNYPNPTFAVDMATQAELNAHVAAADPHPGYLLSSTIRRVEVLTQAAYNALPTPRDPLTAYLTTP